MHSRFPASVGKKAYAKASTWVSPEQSGADGWRRSPEDWMSSAAAACQAVGPDETEAVARERVDDMQQWPVPTILDENKARFM